MSNVNGFIFVLLLLNLVGCKATSNPDKRDAGKWKTETSLEKFDLIGVPAEMHAQAEQMKAQVRGQIEGQIRTKGAKEECLTQAAAAQEDVSKALAKELSGAGECTFYKNIVGKGKIDVAGLCKISGQDMAITMTGTMASKKVEVLLNMSSKPKAMGSGFVPGMTTSLRLVTTHAGECH
jgi:Protein of unknown function (DUF3617)